MKINLQEQNNKQIGVRNITVGGCPKSQTAPYSSMCY